MAWSSPLLPCVLRYDKTARARAVSLAEPTFGLSLDLSEIGPLDLGMFRSAVAIGRTVIQVGVF